jgi:hypothetical protein
MDEIFGSFSASRVTEEWKIRLSLSGSYYKNTYSVEDYNYESSMDSRSFGGLVVRSISDHWSVGAYMGVSSSTYNNTKLSISPAPAIEYDLFPSRQRSSCVSYTGLGSIASVIMRKRFTIKRKKIYGTDLSPRPWS